MNNLLQSVSEVFEVERIGIDDDFRAVPDWSSLKAFGLLVMLENDYGASVDIVSFQQLHTVRDLYGVAFVAFAAELIGVPHETLDLDSAMGCVPGWDSVMHLRLVMEAEKKFGCAYPLETIPQIKNIADFVGKAIW